MSLSPVGAATPRAVYRPSAFSPLVYRRANAINQNHLSQPYPPDRKRTGYTAFAPLGLRCRGRFTVLQLLARWVYPRAELLAQPYFEAKTVSFKTPSPSTPRCQNASSSP
ncbi:MAG: hypothetical protein GY755_00480 [Chloroflexi bacterium]|nr:hypothetical protein [Chloroflexota bacterium]